MKYGLLVLGLAALRFYSAAPIVIKNATVLTITKGTLVGSVVVDNGKIVEAGRKSHGAGRRRVIDAAGQVPHAGNHRLSLAHRQPMRSMKAAFRCRPW